MQLFIICWLTCIGLELHGQGFPPTIKKWKSYPIPTDVDTLYGLSNDPNYWYVHTSQDSVVVSLNSYDRVGDTLPFELHPVGIENMYFKAHKVVYQVTDGYLVGFNRGEFGGGLYWFSFSGDTNYKLSPSRVVQFATRGRELYAFEGLAHLSITEGTMQRIQKRDGKWTSEKYIDLPSAPKAVTLIKKDKFIVLTSEGLFQISKGGHVRAIIRKGIWSYGYPTSMAVVKNDIYVGMPKGVFHFNVSTKKQEWLLPN